MASFNGMSTIAVKCHVDMLRLELLTLCDGRADLVGMFVCVALLTLVMFAVPSSPSSSTDVSMNIFVATATGLGVGCVLIASHSLLATRSLTVKSKRQILASDEQKAGETGSKSLEPSATPVRSASLRPIFSKPTREGRIRQLQTQVNEFCTLSFDDVEATEQSGVTCRMLAIMSMLNADVSYWCSEERLEEASFRLLNLSDIDMRAIRCGVSTAATMVDAHQWRDAYNLLCGLRPWFVAPDDSSLEFQRLHLRDGILELGLPQDDVECVKKKTEKKKRQNGGSTCASNGVRQAPPGCTRCPPSGGGLRGRRTRQKA